MKVQKIKGLILAAISLAISVMGSSSAPAQQSMSSSLGVVPYPAKGQSSEQQNKDEGECYAWAKNQTGVDPIALANTPPPKSAPAAGGGERVRGAARGALGGAAIGAIAGDAGDGAAIGAVVGTMSGGRQARQNQKTDAQKAENAKAGKAQHFNKAFGACLEGKGYVVK